MLHPNIASLSNGGQAHGGTQSHIPATTPPSKSHAVNADLCCGGFSGLSPRPALPLPQKREWVYDTNITQNN